MKDDSCFLAMIDDGRRRRRRRKRKRKRKRRRRRRRRRRRLENTDHVFLYL